MQLPQNLSESDRYWYDIIQQCRTSGLCDNQWLQENNIKSATFYYHVKQLRKKACDLPVSTGRSNRHNEVQEVVPIILDEPKIISTPLPNVVNLSFSRHFLHQKLCHFEIKSIKTIFSTTTLTSPQNK